VALLLLVGGSPVPSAGRSDSSGAVGRREASLLFPLEEEVVEEVFIFDVNAEGLDPDMCCGADVADDCPELPAAPVRCTEWWGAIVDARTLITEIGATALQGPARTPSEHESECRLARSLSSRRDFRVT
jgi:hypothetical protein